MNSLTLIGTVAKDVTVKQSQNGSKFATFSVAVNERQNGQDSATFFDIIVGEKNSRYNFVTGKYGQDQRPLVGKGTNLVISGKVSARAYVGKDGQPHASMTVSAPTIMEYVNVGRRSASASATATSAPTSTPAPSIPASGGYTSPDGTSVEVETLDISGDDLPF